MSDSFYRTFEDKFRGSRMLIKSRLRVYLPFVEPLKDINTDTTALDLGCGRGEFLKGFSDIDINIISSNNDTIYSLNDEYANGPRAVCAYIADSVVVDLVYRMYLEHSCTFTAATTTNRPNVGLVERYGDSLIKECEIEIGGQRIDKHTSMWNRVYSDLTEFNPSGHFGAGVAPDNGDDGTAQSGNGTLYQYMTGIQRIF